MIWRSILFFAVACSSALPANAAARQPTSLWRVDYDAAQCVAMRDYGSEGWPLVLALKPSPKGKVMRILVIRKGSVEVAQNRATLRFGGNDIPISLLTYPADNKQHRMVGINVPMAQFKQYLAAPSLEIRSMALNENFAMSKLGGVVAELDKCLVDLQNYWNAGDGHAARIATRAKPREPLNRIFSPDDYPGMSLDKNQQGSVRLTFLVDEKGGVADCSVEETSGVPALDTMSCYVIRSRARFDPAVGPDGRPIRSAHDTRITWKIGGR
jgi:TonB family protein